MKARDLAALAALGVAGYAAYDKFGRKKDEDNKDEAPKLRGKLGSSKSANDDTEGEYRGNMLGQGRSANEGDAGEAEARMSKSSRQENDVPDRIMGRDAAGSRFTDRAAAVETPVAVDSSGNGIGAQGREVIGRELRQPGQNWGGEGRRSNAAPAAAPAAEAVSEQAQRKFTPPGAQPAMGALSRATKPSGSATPVTSPASGNAAMAAYNQVKTVPRNIQYATEAEKARQRAIDEKNYDSQLNRDRRQAVVDTVSNIPSNITNAFSMPEKTFQNKTYRDVNGKVVRYNKGGIVKKMSSGSMSSSKPKQSTASSRGDGIAQRGKTRGMLR